MKKNKKPHLTINVSNHEIQNAFESAHTTVFNVY